jgi:hypothetical protein
MRKNKLKKLFALGISILCFSTPTLLSFAAEEWTMQTPGVYKLLDGSTLSGVYARGIDVSFWQGDIDWTKVAKDDVKFAILGTRRRSGVVDPKFETYAKAAIKNNIKIGAYIHSYATTVDMAREEADFVLNLIKDYPISYPVVYDVEHEDTQGKLSKSELNAVIRAFTDRIKAAGYYPMVYANDYWIANKIDMNGIKDLDIWVAKYNTRHVYKNPAMWQATDSGKVNGIPGNVDIDFQYKDFTSLIPANTWRTINGNTYYYKDFTMQKKTWINDGKNYYYMDDNGLALKGWFTENNKKYYLDDVDGKMLTGWKSFNSKWYYFGSGGDSKTAWIKDNNSWYYLDKDGIMQSGWQDIQGEKYFFGSSGAMKTGFVDIDDKTYYLQESGVLAKSWINTNSSWYFANKDGIIQKSWLQDKNKWYYMDNKGKMLTGWQDINGASYYFDNSGVMQTGVINVNETLYYLGNDGILVRNSSIDYNSKKYDIDSQGRMIEKKTEETSINPNTEVNIGVGPSSSASISMQAPK